MASKDDLDDLIINELWIVTYYYTNGDGMEWSIGSMENQSRTEALRLVHDAVCEEGDGGRYSKVTRIDIRLQGLSDDGSS